MSHEPWLVDPLGYLIGAGREQEFFARIYEREAFIVHHDAPTRFSGLISLDDIDRIVTTLDLREGQLALADASAHVDADEYVDAANFIDRGAVAAERLVWGQTDTTTPPLAPAKTVPRSGAGTDFVVS